jgi:hypothetical protein
MIDYTLRANAQREHIRSVSDKLRDLAARVICRDEFRELAAPLLESIGIGDRSRQVEEWHERHAVIRREHVSSLMQRHRERKYPTVRLARKRPLFRRATWQPGDCTHSVTMAIDPNDNYGMTTECRRCGLKMKGATALY